MTFPEWAILGALVVLLTIVFGLLSSRSLTEHLVQRGVLPHQFLELIPIILLGARLAAVAMILIGVARFLAVSGLLSEEWVSRYGLASLLVALGVVLFGITFRERRP